jgi:DNA-binding Xre family transcriptional regulator
MPVRVRGKAEPARMLRWNIDQIAKEKGLPFDTVMWRSHITARRLRAIYNGTSVQTKTNTIAWLITALQLEDAGPFFRIVDPKSTPVTIAWTLQELTEARDLVLRDLIYSTYIWQESIKNIWYGRAEQVLLRTLAKLAIRLEIEEVGPLFAWRDDAPQNNKQAG